MFKNKNLIEKNLEKKKKIHQSYIDEKLEVSKNFEISNIQKNESQYTDEIIKENEDSVNIQETNKNNKKK